jgi:hypothetical protein
MIAANAETVAAFLHEVKVGGRAFSTLAVWYALAPYVERDTGEITCSQRTLAKQTSPGRLVQLRTPPVPSGGFQEAAVRAEPANHKGRPRRLLQCGAHKHIGVNDQPHRSSGCTASRSSSITRSICASDHPLAATRGRATRRASASQSSGSMAISTRCSAGMPRRASSSPTSPAVLSMNSDCCVAIRHAPSNAIIPKSEDAAFSRRYDGNPKPRPQRPPLRSSIRE